MFTIVFTVNINHSNDINGVSYMTQRMDNNVIIGIVAKATISFLPF